MKSENLSMESWPPFLFERGVPAEVSRVKSSILGLDLDSLQVILVNDTKIIKKQAPNEWFEIKLTHRWKQILPKGSKILIVNKGKLKMVSVEELSSLIGDVWIATPKKIEVDERECEQRELDLLSYVSYFIGDGYQRRRNEVVLTVSNVGVFDRIDDLCKKVFNYVIPNKDHWRGIISANRGKGFNVRIGATRVCKVLISLGLPSGKKHDIVFIPDIFLTVPADLLIKHCIVPLIDTDGHVDKDIRVTFATTSWKLAVQVFSIFLRVGIFPSFSKVRQKLRGKVFYRYVVRVSGFNQLKKLRKFGFVLYDKRKEARYQDHLSKHFLIRRTQDVIPEELLKPLLRRIIKKFKINVKELAKTSDIPIGTLKCYLAPNVKHNISTIRAKNILKSLEKLVPVDRLNDTKKIINSDIFWDKLKSIRKISNPGFDFAHEIKSNNKLLITNLIFSNYGEHQRKKTIAPPATLVL